MPGQTRKPRRQKTHLRWKQSQGERGQAYVLDDSHSARFYPTRIRILLTAGPRSSSCFIRTRAASWRRLTEAMLRPTRSESVFVLRPARRQVLVFLWPLPDGGHLPCRRYLLSRSCRTLQRQRAYPRGRSMFFQILSECLLV